MITCEGLLDKVEFVVSFYNLIVSVKFLNSVPIENQ